MFKKLLCLFLCIIMSLCFTACDKSIDTNSEKNSEKTYDTLFAEAPSVFVTENITSIAFYGYYGEGTRSEVPNKDMKEIINWLGSFYIYEEFNKVPNHEIYGGTNTYFVEIEYEDGTIINEGLDLVTINGIKYFIRSDKEPDCLEKIKAKSKLIY